MSFANLLNSTCTIQEVVQVQSATGEQIKSWANKATSVAVRHNPVRKPTLHPELGHVLVSESIFYLAATADITDGDRIVHSDGTFEVLKAVKDSSGHHWEVRASKVTWD